MVLLDRKIPNSTPTPTCANVLAFTSILTADNDLNTVKTASTVTLSTFGNDLRLTNSKYITGILPSG